MRLALILVTLASLRAQTTAGPVTQIVTGGTIKVSGGTPVVSQSGTAIVSGGTTVIGGGGGGAATPVISPAAGPYSSTQTVSITDSTTGATICYTTDGTLPTATTPGTCSHGTVYSVSFTVAQPGATVQALATIAGMPNSSVASSVYTIANAMKSKIGFSSSTTSTSGQYYFLGGGASGGAPAVSNPVPMAGNFRNLYARLLSDPDSAASANGYTLTLYRNNSPTTTAVTILSSTPNFEAAYTAADLHVAAGDQVIYRLQSTGTPANTPLLSVLIEFQPDTGPFTGNMAMLFGGTTNNLTTTGTAVYTPAWSTKTPQTLANEINTRMIFPMAGTITNLYTALSAAPGGAASYTLQLYLTHLGMSATAGTALTIAGSSTTGNAAQNVAIAAGDMLDIQVVGNSTPAAVYGLTSILFQPTTNGQFIFAASAPGAAISNTVTNYTILSGLNSAPGATETNAQQVASADFAFQGFTAWLSVAQTGTRTMTLSLREATNVTGAAPGAAGTSYSTAMVATQGPTTSVATSYTPPGNYYLYDTASVPTNAPVATRLIISYVGYIAP